MAKRQPQTIVKELRTLTHMWDESRVIPAYQTWQAARLIDELPSFRSSPQTKLENTLRSIEALLKATLKQDVTANEFNPDAGLIRQPEAYDVNPMLLVGAICRIINTHHGIKPVAYKPVLMPHSGGTLVSDTEPKPKPPKPKVSFVTVDEVEEPF